MCTCEQCIYDQCTHERHNNCIQNECTHIIYTNAHIDPLLKKQNKQKTKNTTRDQITFTYSDYTAVQNDCTLSMNSSEDI